MWGLREIYGIERKSHIVNPGAINGVVQFLCEKKCSIMIQMFIYLKISNVYLFNTLIVFSKQYYRDLSNNQLTGSIPDSIAASTSLQLV